MRHHAPPLPRKASAETNFEEKLDGSEDYFYECNRSVIGEDEEVEGRKCNEEDMRKEGGMLEGGGEAGGSNGGDSGGGGGGQGEGGNKTGQEHGVSLASRQSRGSSIFHR